MDLELHKRIREQIGENLRIQVENKAEEKALRKIDALTGKDYSWIAKVFKGKMNLTIDSLMTIILAYRIDPAKVLDVTIDYDGISEEQLWDYLLSQRKKKKPKKSIPAKKTAKKSSRTASKSPRRKQPAKKRKG